ncbi:MAG: hypothetical protein IJ448_05910 [Oscillospiraceae bacterium]|nr:hypothetical protein [Oscillospiraceae bacterium]
MRYVKTTIILSLLLSIILCSAFSANATDEPIDWSKIDWDTVSIYDYVDQYLTLDPSLEAWLLEEADYSLMFKITSKGDGAFAETTCRIRYERFLADPYGLIQVLALEEPVMQENVMGSIVYGSDWRTFGQFLGSIRLPQSATPMEKAILAEIIRIARDVFYIEVPNTGDPIAMPAALLLLSAAGIVCLTKRKRVV